MFQLLNFYFFKFGFKFYSIYSKFQVVKLKRCKTWTKFYSKFFPIFSSGLCFSIQSFFETFGSGWSVILLVPVPVRCESDQRDAVVPRFGQVYNLV